MTTHPKPPTLTRAVLSAVAFWSPDSVPAEVVAPTVPTTITVLPPLPEGGLFMRDGTGPFTYDIRKVVERTKANRADIPVYLDHVIVGKAYGWIDHSAEPVQGPDGGWEWPVTFTEEGQALLRARAYRYTSMGFHYIPSSGGAKGGEIVGFYENSLVTRPAFPVRAVASAQEAGAYTGYQPSPTWKPMSPEQLALLGLAEDATAEQITAALNSLTAQAARATAIASAAGAAADATPEAVITAAAQAQVAAGALVAKTAYDEALAAKATAETELAHLKSAQAKATAEAAVDSAIAAGKFTPGAREVLVKQATASLSDFQALAATMTAHPAAATASASLQTRPVQPADTAVDPAQAYAQQVLGVSAETYAAGKASA